MTVDIYKEKLERRQFFFKLDTVTPKHYQNYGFSF